MEGSLHAKNSSIRPVISIRDRLVMDGRTDEHMTTTNTMLVAASRGKNGNANPVRRSSWLCLLFNIQQHFQHDLGYTVPYHTN